MTRACSERGFSLIELMIVLCITSILLRVSLPAYSAMQRNAKASQIVGDFNVVRAAVFAQYEATGGFPADGASGIVPAGMTPFLPRDFSFQKPTYELDWESWAVSDSSGSLNGKLVAVTVVSPDEKLGLTVLHMLGANCTHWSAGDAHTFVVENTLESSR
jgi:prepilin-type N-terminal cleavage/methylation domain-containing protein